MRSTTISSCSNVVEQDLTDAGNRLIGADAMSEVQMCARPDDRNPRARIKPEQRRVARSAWSNVFSSLAIDCRAAVESPFLPCYPSKPHSVLPTSLST